MEHSAKEARRQYYRDWQRQNKDKVKGYQEKYWQRKGEQLTAKDAAAQPNAQKEGK